MNCRVTNRFHCWPAHGGTAGFTLVEIAIALGVIGFAMVAIIGILPSGLEVQRDNRAETIINQDATFWTEAIRNGAKGLDDLTNHVEKIEFVEWSHPVYHTQIVNVTKRYLYRAGDDGGYLNGSNIIGLLTAGVAETNSARGVVALVSAISGSASEKGVSADREVGFRYRLNVDVYSPGANTPSFSELSVNQDIPEGDVLDRLYELRMSLSYPVVNEDRPAPRRQIFRTSIARNLLELTNQVPAHYFFIP